MADGDGHRLLFVSPWTANTERLIRLYILPILTPFSLLRLFQLVQKFMLQHFEIPYNATFAAVSTPVSRWSASDVELRFSG